MTLPEEKNCFCARVSEKDSATHGMHTRLPRTALHAADPASSGRATTLSMVAIFLARSLCRLTKRSNLLPQRYF